MILAWRVTKGYLREASRVRFGCNESFPRRTASINQCTFWKPVGVHLTLEQTKLIVEAIDTAISCVISSCDMGRSIQRDICRL